MEKIDLKTFNIEMIKEVDYLDIATFIEEQPQNQQLITAKKVINKILGLVKEIFKQKYRYKEWDEIIAEFYQDGNIMRRYALVSCLTTEKAICENHQCPIFPKLIKIAKAIENLPVYSLEDAKLKNIYGKADLNQFEIKLKELNRDLTEVFQEVYRIYVVNNTIKQKKLAAHARSIEKIKVMAKNNIPYGKQVGREIDADYDEDESILMPDNPKLQEDTDIFNREELLKRMELEKLREGEH